MGHTDLWEQTLWLGERAGEMVQVKWVASHLDAEGNEVAEAAGPQGQELPPKYPAPVVRTAEGCGVPPPPGRPAYAHPLSP